MAKYDTDSEKTIKLDFPVTVDAMEYKELTMRRPKTKDSIAASKFKGSEAERGIFLMAKLCNVSPDVIEELDEVDANKLGEQHKAFTGRQSD
ncbi:phage tail assembly protein [Methylobacterium sp. WCS2018Hpa-22]|uniref:phage tail assembly protein n=1 Tax=Methylobacterium sp. WCS2018Hpa-22 TaxID=3073633 RepID=UPI00288AFAC0|nr:phage tail assembly protein [Methylobacterium sp. WCS2018Hpa-22]